MGNIVTLNSRHCTLRGLQVVALKIEERETCVVLEAAPVEQDREEEERQRESRFGLRHSNHQFFMLKNERGVETVWRDACRSLQSFVTDGRPLCLLYVQGSTESHKVVVAIESSVFPCSVKQMIAKRLHQFDACFLEEEKETSDFDTYYHLLHKTDTSTFFSDARHCIRAKRLENLICAERLP